MKYAIYDSKGNITGTYSGRTPPSNNHVAIPTNTDITENHRVIEGSLVEVEPDVETLKSRVQHHIRVTRASMLSNSDWTQLPDTKLTGQRRAAWVQYRNELRDLPETYQNETDPANIVWPKAPE